MMAVVLLALANVLTVLYCYGRTKMLEDAVNSLAKLCEHQGEINTKQSALNGNLLEMIKDIGDMIDGRERKTKKN